MIRVGKGIAICMTLGLMAGVGFAATPDRVDIEMHKMWLSTSSNCSNPVLIFDDPTPSYRDYTGSPTMGQVNVNNGTYECVIFKMNDLIKFEVPAPGVGNCNANQEYIIDVFRSGESSECPGESTINGANNSSDYPCVYVSRTGQADPPQPFSSASPFILNSDWVVSNDREGTFVTDFTNKVNGSGSQCDVEAPVFDFR